MRNKNRVRGQQEQELVQSIVNPLSVDRDGMNLMGLAQFGGQALLKQAIANEITEYLGRAYYKHLRDGDKFKGERNGYKTTTVDTPIGQMVYDRPLVAYAPNFTAKFHTPHMRRPEAFAEAICDMHINGVSTRSVKRALKSVATDKVRLSKSTVSRITKKLREKFDEWKKRDLSAVRVVYLFLDAIRVKMRFDATKKESVMVAYAVCEDGSFETLSIAVRNSESNQAWDSFVSDLKRRKLRDPLLAISDGNNGVIHAIETYLPTAYRQRCVKHKIENILECVPKEKHVAVRKDINQIFIGATSLEQAKMAIDDFKHKYKHIYPSAVECLERDLTQCLTFFMFPVLHWKKIRTSNRLERMNGEIKRRLRPIGRHPSETGCLAPILKVCKKYTDNRLRGIRVTDLIRALWQKLRERQDEMIVQLELDLEAA